MVFWRVYEDTFHYAHIWLYINKLIKEGKYDEYLRNTVSREGSP